MISNKKSRSRKTAPFSVGGKVFVVYGNRKRVARIVEDRGRIGQGGRQLLRVAFTNSDGSLEEMFEIPATEVKWAKPAATATRPVKAKFASRKLMKSTAPH